MELLECLSSLLSSTKPAFVGKPNNTHTHQVAFHQGLLSLTQIALYIAHNQKKQQQKQALEVQGSVNSVPMLLAYIRHAFSMAFDILSVGTSAQGLT